MSVTVMRLNITKRMRMRTPVYRCCILPLHHAAWPAQLLRPGRGPSVLDIVCHNEHVLLIKPQLSMHLSVTSSSLP